MRRSSIKQKYVLVNSKDVENQQTCPCNRRMRLSYIQNLLNAPKFADQNEKSKELALMIEMTKTNKSRQM